jgi:Cofilin/tropomyosin-type actin-binding protein
MPGLSNVVSIDKNTHEVVPSEKFTFAPGKLEELQDEIPDNAPRFVLLSYEVLNNLQS